MPNLLWPGDHRAGEVFSDDAFMAAMVRVERAWLTVLTANGIAPAEADADLPHIDAVSLAAAGEDAGNPVVALVAELRGLLSEPAASWVHRGLTSQDVLDSALMLCTRDAIDTVLGQLGSQLATLADIAEDHRHTPMLARTLTQPALPTTFGVQVAGWMDGLADAAEHLASLRNCLPVQAGGAAGTMAASVHLAQAAGAGQPVSVAVSLSDGLADELGLTSSFPWHSSRAAITRVGDDLTQCCDAWGRIARDILQGSRYESSELTEPAAGSRGGSSTMPHKVNPVLSVMLHRTALAAPGLASTLHTAAASAVDARADGSWHAEWDTLRMLARRTVVAADQATELLAGLKVNTDAMAQNLSSAPGLDAEQKAIAALTGSEARGTRWGAADQIIDRALARAHAFTKGNR